MNNFNSRIALALALSLVSSGEIVVAETQSGNRHNDPWDRMANWEASVADGTNCRDIVNQLAQVLSRTDSCEEWGKLWTKNMNCAVRNHMTHASIAYCWRYKKDISGLRTFYQMLSVEHGDKDCIIYEMDTDRPTKCRDVATSISYTLEEYSRFPADPNRLVDEVFLAMQRRDFKTVAKYFDSQTVYASGTDAPYAEFNEEFLREYFPKKFSILYKGFQEDDRMFPRKKNEPAYPCIASGPWGDWGMLNFQVIEKPLRVGEPQRFYLMLLYGGCRRPG